MNKKKKRLLVVLLSIASFLTLVLIISVLFINPFDCVRLIRMNLNYEDRCFTEISQFEKLDEYVIENIDPTDDRYLKDLKYTESYTKKIEYNGKTYTVCAYVFEDEESARQYYKNYSPGGGAFNHNGYNSYIFMKWYGKYNAYYNNCSFRINGMGGSAFYDVLNFITEDFPVSLTELDRALTEN